MSHSIRSNATQGPFSLSGNGDGDYYRKSASGYLGDKKRDMGLALANKGSWTPGNGLEYGGGLRNDTSASLPVSSRLNLGFGNGDFSQGGHHPKTSRALSKNYGIDPSHPSLRVPPTSSRMGQLYGADRERMKLELANSNAMASTGNGILPGAIVSDSRTGGPFKPLAWNGATRIDTNSSIRKPGMYSPAISNSAPTFTYNTDNSNINGGGMGINENENNNRVSSLISEAQKANEVLRSSISDSSSQLEDRLNSYTRPSASWNNVGTGGRKEYLVATLADPGQENVRNGGKRQKQDAYRASLERQVAQKSRMMAEEERRFNAHPFGPNYEKPNPVWQSSTKQNRPQDIPIQKRNLAQNSATRISQYEVPHNRVAQARTNLQNSRISLDTYQNNPSKNAGFYNGNTTSAPSQQHQLSNPSGVSANNNFRGQGHSSSPMVGRYEDIPQQIRSEQGMHPGMENNNFQRSSPANAYAPGQGGPARQPPPFYPQQGYPTPPQPGQPQPPQPPHPMNPASCGYPYPANPAYPPGAYPYPQQPYPASYYPFQPPVVGYPQQAGPMMMMNPYGNPYPFPGQANPYPSYENRGNGKQESSRRYNVDEDEAIQQKAAEFERQMRAEQDGNYRSNGLKPSRSTFADLEQLKCFVEEKLTEKNVDFDELRELAFGRPDNLKTSDEDIDYKPIKDMINRAELAEQIKINQHKKALQAAKDLAEEEKLERKLQEFYGLQREREHNAKAQKDELSRVHILNKKAVSKHFLTEQTNRQFSKMPEMPKIIPREFEPRPRMNNPPPREHPEQSLARKIRNPPNPGEGNQHFGDPNNWQRDQNHGRGDQNNSEEYSYAKYMSQFNPPPSPPIPTLAPKTNEETLRGKLNNKTFSRPRQGPSMQNADAPDMRTRMAVENGLKNKISNSNS